MEPLVKLTDSQMPNELICKRPKGEEIKFKTN